MPKRPNTPRKRTEMLNRTSKRHLQVLREEHAEDVAYLETIEHTRPKTRADCERVPRPCPWVSCKQNLYLDTRTARQRGGGSIEQITFNFPDVEPGEMKLSCALDIADEGGVILERVGAAMNITRERARQLEEVAKKKIKLAGGPDLSELHEANCEIRQQRGEHARTLALKERTHGFPG